MMGGTPSPYLGGKVSRINNLRNDLSAKYSF
jgi:hypothetical protein